MFVGCVDANAVYGLYVPSHSSFWWPRGLNFLLGIGVESAAFPGQSQDEIDRLLHIVCLSIRPSVTKFSCTFFLVSFAIIGRSWRWTHWC